MPSESTCSEMPLCGQSWYAATQVSCTLVHIPVVGSVALIAHLRLAPRTQPLHLAHRRAHEDCSGRAYQLVALVALPPRDGSGTSGRRCTAVVEHARSSSVFVSFGQWRHVAEWIACHLGSGHQNGLSCEPDVDQPELGALEEGGQQPVEAVLLEVEQLDPLAQLAHLDGDRAPIWLSSIDRLRSEKSVPNDGGIVPASRLWESSKSSSLVRLPSETGIWPVSWLRSSLIVSADVMPNLRRRIAPPRCSSPACLSFNRRCAAGRRWTGWCRSACC